MSGPDPEAHLVRVTDVVADEVTRMYAKRMPGTEVRTLLFAVRATAPDLPRGTVGDIVSRSTMGPPAMVVTMFFGYLGTIMRRTGHHEIAHELHDLQQRIIAIMDPARLDS